MKTLKKLLSIVLIRRPMRKSHILIILMLCLLLSACSAASKQNPADPTTATQPTSINNQETETPSDPEQTDTPPIDLVPAQSTPTEQDPNALTENEIAELQEIYKFQRTPDEFYAYRFYNIALGQTYSDPREINLYSFFYNGDFAEWNMTDTEDVFIKSAIRDAEYMDQFRATPENMDDILQMCFGLSLQDMQGNGLDRFAYFEETGCYYNATTSPPSRAEFLEITGGSHMEDGNLQVFYTAYYNKQLYVMILKPVDGGYHILSNLEVEE